LSKIDPDDYAYSMTARQYSFSDQAVISLDQALGTLFGRPKVTERDNPAKGMGEPSLNAEERALSGRLMRVNHSGEVAAQGLYQGQALSAKLPEVRDAMTRAAMEENDHLAWCEGRIDELGSRKSLLNPLWYTGAMTIGALAGAVGDKWSLGFVAETEYQVVRHLDDHLARLPDQDTKSRAILEQMREDEGHHATIAIEAGGTSLPGLIRALMTLTSKVMTKTALWI